jgi:hypothetical protein
MQGIKPTRFDHHLRHTEKVKVATAPPAVSQNGPREGWYARPWQIVTDKSE